MLRFHTVEDLLVSIIQVFAPLGVGIWNQATLSEDIRGPIHKFPFEKYTVIALVPCPPESCCPFTGVDEEHRKRDLAFPEQSEADKVGAIVEVGHLS